MTKQQEAFELLNALRGANVSYKAFAEITGIRPSTVSAICTGSIKEIPVGVLNKICAALNCQPGDLMEYLPDEE